jgi:hypothetical protein
VLKDSLQVGSSLYADGVQPELQFPLYQIHREGVKVCSIWLLVEGYTGTQAGRRPLAILTTRSMPTWELSAIIKSAMRNSLLLSLLGFFFLSSSTRPQSQEAPSSLIETIAGGEANGEAGADFSFGSVAGLAADTAGNTYFTLQALSRVYRLGVDGHVTSFAGSGVRGKQRNEVLATASPLLNPASLAVDAAGNLFIASWHSLLRMDTATGFLSTVFYDSIPAARINAVNSRCW